MRRRSGRRGCGRWPSDSTKIEHRRTAIARRARPPWRHSPRVGGGSRPLDDTGSRARIRLPQRSSERLRKIGERERWRSPRQKTMKPMRYVYPLDPECPVVAEFMETLFGDPTTMAMGAPVEDITEEFERRHRKQCKRCQEYAVRHRVTE